MLNDKISVINVGTDVFANAVKEQGIPAEQLNWKPGKKVVLSKRAKEILDKAMYSDFKKKIDAANAKVKDIMDNTDPYWIGVKPAKECVPGVEDGMIIHSGPDISWDRMCQTQQQGGINGVMYEGYAKTQDEARRMLENGTIKFVSANDYHLVGPGSGITTPSMAVNIVEDKNTGFKGFCPPFEGPNRGGLAGWGILNDSIKEHLDTVRDIIAPAMTKVLEANGGIAMRKIFTRGVEMGDELHSRQDACGLILTNELAKMIFDTKSMNDDEKRQVMDLIFGTVRFFHPLGMASAMSGLEAARHVPYSTVVTAMEGNGVTYGIKVAGLGNQWFTAPAPRLEGEYVAADIKIEDVLPWIGDSCMLEACGLGGSAAAAAPAVMRSQGLSWMDGIERSRLTEEITLARHESYLVPALDYQGTPLGIDIRKVLRTGIEPVIHGGIISKSGKRLGAGVAHVPMKCFEGAIEGYAERYGL